MKVIGIIGGMGAGKSTVIEIMNEIEPISYILADTVGHDILLKGHEAYETVVRSFGNDILDSNGEIIRRKLGQKVFHDPKQLVKLNEITHPIIRKKIEERIKRDQRLAPDRLIVLEAALLLEGGLKDLTDKIVAVYADPKTRVERVVRREGLEEEQILQRFKAQKDWEEIKQVADYIIDNSISRENTKRQVANLLVALSGKEQKK